MVSVGATRLYVGFAARLPACPFLHPQRIAAAAEALAVRDFALGQVRLNFQRFDPPGPNRAALRIARRARLVLGLRPLGNILKAEKPDRAACPQAHQASSGARAARRSG